MSKLFGFAVLALVPLAVPAHATIVTTSYEVGYLLNPPASVVPGALTSNLFIDMFTERTAFVLPSPITVDINTPNVVYGSHSQLTGGVQIPAGTIVNSYYVHANVTVDTGVKFSDQFVGFSEEEQILGVMVVAGTIEAANPIVGSPTTTYDTTLAGIGLHFAPTGKDFIVLQPATTAAPANTVTFREVVSPSSVTDFRIITTIVPTGTSVRSGVK